MDVIQSILGLGAVGLFVIGAILLIAANVKILPAFKMYFQFGGAIFIMLAIIVGAGFTLSGTTTEQAVGETALYDVTVSEATAYESIDSDAHIVVCAMTYNTTSNAFVASSGICVLNATILRADALLTDSVTQVSIGAIPLVDVTGAASEPILSENTDDTYNADMVKSGAISTHESINVLVPASGSAFVNVTLNINGDAVHAMSLYESQNIPLYIAGELWTVQCELVHIDT